MSPVSQVLTRVVLNKKSVWWSLTSHEDLLFLASLFFTFPLWPPIPAELSCPQLPWTVYLSLSAALSCILFSFLGSRTLLSSFYAPSTVLSVRDINMRKEFFCLFYRGREWDSGTFGDLPRFTPLLRDGAGGSPPFLKPVCWPLHFSHLVWTPLEMKILLLLPKEII